MSSTLPHIGMDTSSYAIYVIETLYAAHLYGYLKASLSTTAVSRRVWRRGAEELLGWHIERLKRLPISNGRDKALYAFHRMVTMPTDKAFWAALHGVIHDPRVKAEFGI